MSVKAGSRAQWPGLHERVHEAYVRSGWHNKASRGRAANLAIAVAKREIAAARAEAYEDAARLVAARAMLHLDNEDSPLALFTAGKELLRAADAVRARATEVAKEAERGK